MYDMHELALSNIKTTSQFPATKKGVELMNRPVMLFQGDAFESDAQLSELKGLFLDMYQHQSLGKINLAGLEHAVVLTAKGSKVAFRHYSISLKKSGERVPKIQLEEIGPSFDMEVRRQQLPSAQVRYDFPAPILPAQSQHISSSRMSF
jgi:ribosome production factor 2